MRLVLAEAEDYTVTKDCLQDTRFLPGQINIGLVWGYATDGSRWPEWILTVTREGWRLNHVTSKYVFNPALSANMEIWTLPRYFFYDAWRETPKCNKPEQLLHFRKGRTPLPKGLQAGVNIPAVQEEARNDRIQSATVDAAPTQNDQESSKPCGNSDADQAAPSKETEWKAAEEAVAAYALAVYKAKLGQGQVPEALSLELLSTVSPAYPLARLSFNLASLRMQTHQARKGRLRLYSDRFICGEEQKECR
eukprot:s972_g31.t1